MKIKRTPSTRRPRSVPARGCGSLISLGPSDVVGVVATSRGRDDPYVGVIGAADEDPEPNTQK